MLDVSNLSASYGANLAVRSIDLKISRGSLSALLGANGAGKPMALRSTAGLHRPVTGSIKLGGQEISKLAMGRKMRSRRFWTRRPAEFGSCKRRRDDQASGVVI
jgi:branched-chain amino acid transport system ATP-binding protein